VTSLAKQLLAPPYRKTAKALGRLSFERGTPFDTAQMIELQQLGVDKPERTRYEPSRWLYLHRAFRTVEVRDEDVFIDFGSGMGRVVAQAASRYPFKRVIGLEVASDLTDMARANVDRLKDGLRCQNVELVTADALTYPIPDDVTIAYFHNPFVGDTFRTVIDKLVESLERNPRSMTVVYVNPVEDQVVRETGRFRLVHCSKGLRRDVKSRWIYIYRAL
jgi:protein-L-isoaspartate O-methyltransferase